MPNRAELPIQDSDDARLCRMQNHVIELVVAVDDAGSVARYILADVVNDLIEIRVGPSKFLASFDVFYFRLLSFDSREGIAVSIVEACFLSEILQAN